MPKYKYKFCDGTFSEVEVSNEHYALLKTMDKQEKENDRQNKQRTTQKQHNGKSEINAK